MPLFTIDQDKCARDGICAAECPMGIIALEHGIPEPVEGADKMCIDCGHCVAVCPTGAFGLAAMAPAACAPVDKDRLPSAEALDHLIRAQRSTRVYKNKPVEKEKLVRLLDTARYAPTGKNAHSSAGWWRPAGTRSKRLPPVPSTGCATSLPATPPWPPPSG